MLREYYAKYTDKLCADCQTRLTRNTLRLLDCKKRSCQHIADSAPKSVDYLCPECHEHFGRLKKYLGLLGLPFEINHRLVRGLDYYTRTVFEIEPQAGAGQSTLGGGGRYDNLIEELGGKPTPGIGFAVGMERVILNLKQQDVSVPPLSRPQVFLASLGDAAKDETIKLASRLRQAGLGVIEATGDKSLKAQLRQANTLGVSRVVIIGDQEIASGTVILRNMSDAEQESVPLARLPALLKRVLRDKD